MGYGKTRIKIDIYHSVQPALWKGGAAVRKAVATGLVAFALLGAGCHKKAPHKKVAPGTYQGVSDAWCHDHGGKYYPTVGETPPLCVIGSK